MRAVTVAIAMSLLLAGCGDTGFDPASAEACDFLTREEREEYGLRLARNEPGNCAWGPLVISDVFVSDMFVQYQDREPAAVAAELRIPAIEGRDAPQTTIAFRGPVTIDDKYRRCVLVAPMDGGRSLVVTIGFDTSHSRFRKSDLDGDPCDVLANELPLIEQKLRR